MSRRKKTLQEPFALRYLFTKFFTYLCKEQEVFIAVEEKNTAGSHSPTPRYKAYSITDVMAAGGTTAFANSVGKNTANIQERLNKLPDNAFLTKDEADKALEMLNGSK